MTPTSASTLARSSTDRTNCKVSSFDGAIAKLGRGCFSDGKRAPSSSGDGHTEAAWSLFDRSIDSGFSPTEKAVALSLDEVTELAAIIGCSPRPARVG